MPNDLNQATAVKKVSSKGTWIRRKKSRMAASFAGQIAAEQSPHGRSRRMNAELGIAAARRAKFRN
jgi:hypothetical protein